MNPEQAVTKIWDALDSTWDGDERPSDWDAICDAMQSIMEALSLQYDEHGDMVFAEYRDGDYGNT